MDHES
jgi:hypothetical protein